MRNFYLISPKNEIKEIQEDWKIWNRCSGHWQKHEKIEHVGHLAFLLINNEAEYEVLLEGLKIEKVLRVKKLEILIDSQLGEK